MDQQKLIESLEALFSAECLHADQQRRCAYCGAVMQYRDATFWLYGTDSGWNVRLPVCTCEEEETVTLPEMGVAA